MSELPTEQEAKRMYEYWVNKTTELLTLVPMMAHNGIADAEEFVICSKKLAVIAADDLIYTLSPQFHKEMKFRLRLAILKALHEAFSGLPNQPDKE